MQEWLTVIIVLLIVAVVLDGVRRMRQSRRSGLRMSRNVNQNAPAAVDDITEYGSELPSGGARVVNVRKARDVIERNEQIRQSAEQKRRNQLKSFRIPEQVSLKLDQQVPTLMESVREAQQNNSGDDYQDPIHDDGYPQEDIAGFNDDDRIEPVISNDREDVEDGEEVQDDWDRAGFSDGSEGPVKNEAPVKKEIADKVQTANTDTTYPDKTSASQEKSRTLSGKTEVPPSNESEDDYRDPELVLVINVMAQKGEQFPGAELLDIILGQGLRFGAMNIFHRHEEDNGEGEILYSMANIVMPGTFELAKMKTFSTPGVSFFLTLPMDANSIDAFEDMLTTAKIIGARLNGELKDENRSVLTPQTITHYRSKLQEFARKQLSKAPA